MTNMEGWVYFFLSLFIGIPVLSAILLLAYFRHRQNVRKEKPESGEERRGDRLSSIESIRQLVLTPDQFFKRITATSVNLWQPFVWLTAGGMGLVFAIISSTGFSWEILTSNLVIGIVALPLLLIPLYIYWGISSVLLYVLTIPLRGEGRIGTTLQNTGYGFAFGLFLIDLLYLILAIPIMVFDLHFIVGGGGSDPLASTVYQIIIAASAIIVLWSAGIVSIGLRYARNIPLFRAAALVYILAITGFVWTNQTYLVKMSGSLAGF